MAANAKSWFFHWKLKTRFVAWRMLCWVNAWRKHDWFYFACLYFPSQRKLQNSLKDLRIRTGVSNSWSFVTKCLRFWILCTHSVLTNALIKGQICNNIRCVDPIYQKGHKRWIALRYIIGRPAIGFFFWICSKLKENIHIMNIYIYWSVGPLHFFDLNILLDLLHIFLFSIYQYFNRKYLNKVLRNIIACLQYSRSSGMFGHLICVLNLILYVKN